jgi:subtilase family serine protease
VRSRLGIAAFMLAFVASIFSATTSAQTVMTHHLHAPLRNAALQPVGKLPSSQILTLDVVLPLRDPQGLLNFATLVSDPSSPSYRQFLTSSQVAAAYGPKQADYDTLVAFLKNNGFTIYGGSFLGREVQVKAPVSVIEAAFHVAMNVYQHPTENRTFFSADREPTTNLPFPLWHISGLDNFSIPKPLYVKRADVAKAKGVTPQSLTPNATTGSGPSASFLGSDMRAAYYSAAGGTLTGTGMNVGLWEYEGTDLADLTTYYKNVNQTLTVPVIVRSSDGTDPTCFATVGCDDTEQSLDETQALGMAPGLASLTVYVGSLDTAIISDMLTHYPVPTSIGCSWGWTPPDNTTLDPYFQQMAAQGMNFFAASGDDSTWSASQSSAAFPWPADDTWIVSVGGTDLVTASAAGPWASETAWADSGGGISTTGQVIPTWQVAAINSTNKGSLTLRNGPDVSANANFTFYTCSDQTTCLANDYGGTSFAAPMWAGYMALVNQGLVAKTGKTLGFLNPVIYAENATAATYASNFHDILTGTSGSYSAGVGFDLVTGWGSPTQALATTLIGTTPVGSPVFGFTTPTNTYTAAPYNVPLADSVDVTSYYGFTGAVALSCTASGGLKCTLGSASTTLVANANNMVTLTIDPSAVTVTGTYSVTVTATGSTGTKTLLITVGVVAPDFTIAAATSSYNLTAIGSATDNITLTSTLGFVGSVGLSCSATGGLTCSLSPTSTSLTANGTSTSTLSFGNAGVNIAGTYSITVTGTGVPGSHSVTITVTTIAKDFTIAAATPAYSTASPATLVDTINLTSVYGFSGTVALSCSGPTGIFCYLSPIAATLTPNGTATSTLTIDTTGVKTVGAYTVTVKGAGPVLTHSTQVTVNVTSIVPQAFIVTNAGDIIIPTQGASAQTGIIITPVGTFASPVALTCAIVSTPVGASAIPTCSVPTSVVMAQSTTNYTPILTINTTAQTLQGSIAIKPVAWLAGGLFFALLLIPTLRRRRLPMLAVLLISGLMLGNVIGCSKTAQPISINSPSYVGGTTLGSYVVTVTGTSGTSTSTTYLHLTVN